MKFGSIPIVQHEAVSPTTAQQRAVEQLAEDLLREQPQLGEQDQWQPYIPTTLNEGPSLHLDDLSEIPLLDGGYDVRYLQDRARLRAGDGDTVATCAEEVEGYETYCREQLELGDVEWLRPVRPAHPRCVALACWEDRHVRKSLVHQLRSGELSYLHPHMGTFSTWELAVLLHGASRRPIRVIAPPPAVTAWTNDKIQFARAVSRLFGEEFVPRTTSAWNVGMLSRHVSELAEIAEVIGLKLPNSAGGDGIVVLDAMTYRGQPLHAVHDLLQPEIAQLAWEGNSELLIDTWETDVLCSPSAQMWIPPEPAGLPIIEGIFVQQLEGRTGFVGATAATFPACLRNDLATRSWLIARLFQRLGYVGRCSLDLILVGTSLSDCRLEFIECNGRWGGTSLPMTLMNRLFGDWQRRPFSVRVVSAPGLDQVSFAELIKRLRGEIYNHRTGDGRLIFYSPGRMQRRSSLSVLALGNSWDEAAAVLSRQVPQILHEACCNLDTAARFVRNDDAEPSVVVD